MPRRSSRSQGVQDRQQVDDFLSDRTSHRRQMSERSQQHTDEAEQHAADRALQGDPPQTLADVQQLVHFAQRAVEDHGVRSFGGDVGAAAERDADRRRCQSRASLMPSPTKTVFAR